MHRVNFDELEAATGDMSGAQLRRGGSGILQYSVKTGILWVRQMLILVPTHTVYVSS